jgi:hypothetical protein
VFLKRNEGCGGVDWAVFIGDSEGFFVSWTEVKIVEMSILILFIFGRIYPYPAATSEVCPKGIEALNPRRATSWKANAHP